MAEGAGGSIFMDIMPRLEQSALGSVVNDLTNRMSKLGNDVGGSFGKDFGNAASTASQRMAQQLEQNMQRAQRAVETSMDGMIRSQNNLVNSGGKVEAAQKKLTETIAKYGEESSKAITAQNNLVKAQQGAEAASRASERAIRDQAAANTALADATKAQQEHLNNSSNAAAGFGRAMTTAGAAVSVGFVAAVGLAVDKAGDFQASTTRLVTSAGEAASNLKLVSDGILQMAGQVGYTADELSKGMYTVESAGIHGADALKVLQAAAQGARAEGADLTEVTDAVTTALHDYHLGADQAALVTSKMVTAVGDGKTTFQSFASSLASVQPLAGAAHISIDDLYGSLAAMTASGMSADRATQNMADAIRHLSSPTAQMREELSQMGIDSNDLAMHLGDRGLAGSMEMISTAIMQHMGPSGGVLLDTFNKSKSAAADAQRMFDALPPAARQVAQAVKDGSLSFTEFRKTGGGLAVDQKLLIDQWLNMYKTSTGFSQALKTGGNDVQAYQSALAKATGDASSMNVALMLTGENAEKTRQNIADVAGTTTEADGSVKGWAETQSTFNTRMSEFKASIGASAITIGNDFLPAATSVAKTLSDVGQWLSKNKGFLDALLISVGSAAAAFAAFKTVSAMWTVMNIGIEAASAAMGLFTVAEEGATAGAGGLAAALAATGISEVVLGVTALVAAIAGLVVGVKYAYDHWTWFHNAVQAVWNVLKAVGEWIGSTAVSVWHVLEAAIRPIETVFKDIGNAAMWLWHNVIEPAANGISLALRIAGAVVFTVLAAPFVLAFKIIEAAVKFLYENVIQPVFKGLETIFHWLYDNVVQPVVDLIKMEIQGWGLIFNWLHDNVIDPVFHAIGDVWHWLYDTIIHPIVDLIKVEIDGWGKAFSWLHDNVIKPVGDAIGVVMGGIKTVFKDCVDWIETQWNRIVGIVGPPVKFIVDTVYNAAIVPTWNAIAGVFGLGELKTVDAGSLTGGNSGGAGAPAPGGGAGAPTPHAGGGVWQGDGVLPGYAPGRDSVNAILSPGEGVAVPELVQAIGPSNFMALNAHFSGGRKPGSGPGYDAGTIIGDIGGGIGHLLGGAVNAGKKAVTGAVDTAKFLAKLATDPEGAVRDLFSNVTAKTAGTPGDPSKWLDAIKSMPGKVIDSVVQKALAWVSGHQNGGAPGIPFVGSPDLEGWISQAIAITGVGEGWRGGLNTLIGRESGGNPNAINNWDSNAAAGDPSRGLMQTIGSTFESYRDKSLPDNIYDPVANIVAGINYIKARYGDIGNVQQANPNMPPKGYEGGGIAPGGKKQKKAPVNKNDRTAIDRALNWVRSLAGQPYNAQGWLDCSGLISGVYDELLDKPLGRAFTTVSDFGALGWKRGTGGIAEIGVTPKPGNAGHMAMTLDGHRIESGGAHNNIAIDGPAAGADDPQFSDHWYLPGKLFHPAFLGSGAVPGASNKTADKLNADNSKWSKAANKAKDEQQKAEAAAAKHDQTAQKHLDDAAKQDQLAATSSGKEHQKHVDAANHSRQLAQNSKDAAQKSRDQAAKYAQQAQDDQAKADAAAADATGTGTTPDPLNPNGTTGTGTSGTNSNGLVQPMSFTDLTSKLGGIAGSAFLETTGMKDPLQTPVLRIAQQLAGAKFFQYDLYAKQAEEKKQQEQQKQEQQAVPDQLPESVPDSTDEQPTPIEAQVFDEGGWLQPNKLALNLGRKPEPVLAPREKDNLEAIAKGGAAGMQSMVHIEHMHVTEGDGRKVGRDIYREMLAYQGGSAR